MGLLLRSLDVSELVVNLNQRQRQTSGGFHKQKSDRPRRVVAFVKTLFSTVCKQGLGLCFKLCLDL